MTTRSQRAELDRLDTGHRVHAAFAARVAGHCLAILDRLPQHRDLAIQRMADDLSISYRRAAELLAAYSTRGPRGLARALYLTREETRDLLALLAATQETTHE